MKHTTVFAAIAAVCTAAMPSFADTTLTWNGADGASWTGEGGLTKAQLSNRSPTTANRSRSTQAAICAIAAALC